MILPAGLLIETGLLRLISDILVPKLVVDQLLLLHFEFKVFHDEQITETCIPLVVFAFDLQNQVTAAEAPKIPIWILRALAQLAAYKHGLN